MNHFEGSKRIICPNDCWASDLMKLLLYLDFFGIYQIIAKLLAEFEIFREYCINVNNEQKELS